jgi:hypothetical protein
VRRWGIGNGASKNNEETDYVTHIPHPRAGTNFSKNGNLDYKIFTFLLD